MTWIERDFVIKLGYRYTSLKKKNQLKHIIKHTCTIYQKPFIKVYMFIFFKFILIIIYRLVYKGKILILIYQKAEFVIKYEPLMMNDE